MNTPNAISKPLLNRQAHLERLWRAYLDHPTARQADKWLAGYFREHKAYGKKDRAWYSEEFFRLLRIVITTLPRDAATDAASVWQALRTSPPPPPLLGKERGGYGGGEDLPNTWKAWLAHASLPPQDIPQFLEKLATKPPLYLRVNHSEKLAAIETELKAAHFVITITQCDSGLTTLAVKGEKPIYELQCIKEGLVEIQDLASQRLGEAVDAHPGMAVWDVCAGGGGKTMQIASQLKNRGVLYASDIRDYKLDELKLRARRAGFHNVRRFVYDAEAAFTPSRELKNSGGFHRILVDAPCSASGTLRRNPDVRFRLMPGDIEKFAALQYKILAAVHPHLKKGGKLVYATCSVFRDENEDVIEKFLQAVDGFTLLKSELVGSPWLDADTMFYAVLEKK